MIKKKQVGLFVSHFQTNREPSELLENQKRRSGLPYRWVMKGPDSPQDGRSLSEWTMRPLPLVGNHDKDVANGVVSVGNNSFWSLEGL